MYCKNCGKQIADNLIFCDSCGAKQDSVGENNKAQDANENVDLRFVEEQVYEADLKKKKKYLAIIGAAVVVVVTGVVVIDSSIEAGEKIGFATKLQAVTGDAEAQYKIGCSLEGASKIRWLKKSADKEYAEAQAELGYCYYTGNGVVKDTKEAVKWFQRAADNGSPYGQFMMAWAYSKGEGVEKDSALAVSWYKKAVDNDSVSAMNNLAVCYELGEGVEKNLQEAFKLFEKASDKGNLLARTNLARMYEQGLGVNKDRRKALELYKAVADKKLWLDNDEKKAIAKAMYNTGRMYYFGIENDVNIEEGLKYLNKAKEKGNANAIGLLAFAYYYGKGVAMDKVKARELAKEASDKGDYVAKKMLEWM